MLLTAAGLVKYVRRRISLVPSQVHKCNDPYAVDASGVGAPRGSIAFAAVVAALTLALALALALALHCRLRATLLLFSAGLWQRLLVLRDGQGRPRLPALRNKKSERHTDRR